MRCCVPYCNNVLNNESKSRGISFHALPSKIWRRKAWLKALCIAKSNAPLYANVCSEHFDKEVINVGANGKRRLHKDAVPLSVQACLICLDTESVLCTLNLSKLEMAYETLTGLSLSNMHVETICAGCAQRLREYSHFRDECLKSNQLMIELVEKQSLTVQNIREIKQQSNQINCSTEHENKENSTQTEINALHETVDLKYEISEEIYDVYTDDDDSVYRNYETGELNHEHNVDLCAEYEETVNAIQVCQNDTETYAPYIEVERIDDIYALENGKVIEKVMGKSRDKVNIYLKRNDDDTVEIYVIENKNTDELYDTGMFITSNDLEKTVVVHAPEREEIAQESHISGGTELINVKDKCKEIFARDNLEESTIKVENDEMEIIPTYNEVNEIIENAMETNLSESVMNGHKEQTESQENGIEDRKQTDKENVIEKNDNLQLKMRDKSLIENNMESHNEDLELRMNDRSLIEQNMETQNDNLELKMRDRCLIEENMETNNDNLELKMRNRSLIEENMETQNDLELKMRDRSLIEENMETKNDNFELKMRDRSLIEENMETQNVLELKMRDRCLIEENMETQNDLELKIRDRSLIKENMETQNDLELKMRDRSLIENMEYQNDNLGFKMRDIGKKLMDEVITDDFSERVDNEIELADGVERTLKCTKCSETFLDESRFKNHMKGCIEESSQWRMRKSGSFILKFDELLKKIKVAKVEKQHSPQNSPKRNIDDSDDENTERDIKRTKRDVRLKLSFISDSSESIEVRTSYITGRIRNGNAKFKCNDCDYRCRTRKLLNQHILIHTGEKPYSCHICEYKCAQKGHLDQHLRTHTGVKPYYCEFCEYRCAQKSQLDQHLRRHTGLRPYSCVYCEYTCSQMCHLDQHLRVHTGERPFTCKFCNSKFVQKSALVQHMNHHVEESS